MLKISQQAVISSNNLRSVFPVANDGSFLVHESQVILRHVPFYSFHHYSPQGDLLWKLDKVGSIEFITVPRPNEVVYYDQHNQTIRMLNLRTHSSIQVPNTLSQTHPQMFYRVQYFYRTDILLLIASDNLRIPRFQQLRFYDYESFKKGKEPVASAIIQKKPKARPLVRVNDHSKMGEWCMNHKNINCFSFRVFWLDHKNIKIQTIASVAGPHSLPQLKQGCFSITHIWEWSCNNYRADVVHDCQGKEGEQRINSCLYFIQIDASYGKEHGLASLVEPEWQKRHPKSQMPIMKSLVSGNITLHQFQTHSQNMDYLWQDDNPLHVYVYGPTQEQILSGLPCFCPQQMSAASWNPDVVTHVGEEERGRRKVVTVVVLYPMDEVHLQCLLHLNQDFDDDLLQQAVYLLSDT